MSIYQKFAIDELRNAARYFDCLSETFNQRFSVMQLLSIWRYSRAHGDIDERADHWDAATLNTALTWSMSETIAEWTIEPVTGKKYCPLCTAWQKNAAGPDTHAPSCPRGKAVTVSVQK